MRRHLLLLALLPLLAAPGAGPKGSLEPVSTEPRPVVWYPTGPSNFAAAADIPGPWNRRAASVLQSPSIPGSVDRGWWNVIQAAIQPRGLVMPVRNNSVGGYTTCNYLYPYCCRDTSINRIESCSGDDATGDAECNAHNAGATCEQSNTYYLESQATTPWESPSFEGIDRIDPTVVTIAPGPNECTRPNTTVAEIIDTTRDLIDALLAYGRVEKVYLHKGISWHQRVHVPNNWPVCQNLWEDSCASCDDTFEDLIAEYPGTVILQDGPYRDTLGKTTMSGTATLWEMYTADTLHENIFGWYLVTIPDFLRTLGFAVTDTPPPHPEPVVDSVTTTTATVSLAGPIVDADGDTLTCLLWAHATDTAWLGGYQGADRVHNGWNVCKQKAGGTPCANCGDASSDTDCNAQGAYTDADSTYWLTPADAPVVPDGAAEGVATMPDFFEIDCDGETPRTIHGLAPDTEYRLLAIAWPTIVRHRTDRGILPSEINDLVTFTTAAE